MNLIILSMILIFHQTHSSEYEYDEVFANIVYCGTDIKAYPFCAEVDESPIDLKKFGSLDGDRLNCNGEEIDWDYNGRETFKVEKKEHTIEVMVPIRNGKTDKNVAKFKNPVDPITSKTKVDKFCLEQVHFHWDDDDQDLGSEHAVDGKKWPLEAHFVHFNCERDSVTDVQNQYPNQTAIYEARQSGRDVHELAVIGVFFKIRGNKANPTIDRILDAAELILEKEKKNCKDRDIEESPCVIDESKLTDKEKRERAEIQEEREEILSVTMSGIELDEILTDDILESGYWTYEGSLTTPPCTDDVRWFNMKKESYISEAQWDRYRRITRPCDFDTLIAPNWRPLQNNQDPVFFCKGDDHHRHRKRGCDGDSDESGESQDSDE